MSSPNKFADIILPVRLPRLFTYHIPSDLYQSVELGKRVVVSFGKKKTYSGIIYQLHNKAPEEYETKPVISVLDSQPIVSLVQLKFWDWLADYYQCTLGEIYKAALPSGLKMESETNVIYNAEFIAEKPLSANEDKVLDIVSGKKICTISEVNQLSGLKNCLPIIKRLLDYNAIFISEKLKEGYKAKKSKYVGGI